MSVRDYARNYLPDGSRRPAAATGRGAVGSDASSGSTPGLGTHALDGAEHTDATGTDLLLATTDHAGLMPPLSGNPATFLDGTGEFSDPASAFSGDAGDIPITDPGSHFTATDVEGALQELAELPEPALDDLTDVDTSGVSDGDLLSYDLGSTTWVPVAAPSGSVPSGTDPGDILVWDGDSWEVLPVGTDGQVIYADSGETLGLLWDDAPTGGGGGGGLAALDIPPVSAHAKDDEFDGTSLDGKWTNPATSTCTNTITVGDGYLTLEPAAAGTGSTGQRGGFGIRQAAPASDFTIMAKIVMGGTTSGSSEVRGGIFVADTGTPKVNIWGLIHGGFGRLVNADGASYSESADWSGYDGFDSYLGGTGGVVWVRIRWVTSSSTLFFDYSTDGYFWNSVTSRGSSVQPNRIGIAQWSNSADIPKDNKLVVEWFRVTEP